MIPGRSGWRADLLLLLSCIAFAVLWVWYLLVGLAPR